MSAENQEPDFEALRRLLKLKRHEQPPPRYFHDFSGHVLSRIRAGTPGARFESFEDIIAQSSWLRRIWGAIEGRPAISGIFAAAVCGLLVAGIFISENTPPSFDPILAQGGQGGVVTTKPEGELFANSLTAHLSSTNPSPALPGANLFERMHGPGGTFQPVNALPMPR
jgi:hypothetical protein